MSKIEKIRIANGSDKPLTISLEPWGEDYTLIEKEKVEIIAEDCSEDFYFSIVFNNDYVGVYPEGKGREYPQVYSDGKLIYCGHHREFSKQNPKKRGLIAELLKKLIRI